MNNYEQKRLDLINQCENLLDLLKQKLPGSLYQSTLSDLLEDLKSDSQLITVLGEFKRGKSTLLNAFIRNSLLPSDVTPRTATINVIKHAKETNMDIVMQDGNTINTDLSSDSLKKFTFEKGTDLNQVHHIDIELPLPHLAENVILIDTPGVGDLNEHRLDVTYSYIPRSSLIMFVFDATTPIRKTEIDYLKDTVLKLKYGEIVFVANFIDRLDEDEWEETKEYMLSRLKKVMGEEHFELFPLSSKEALTNVENSNFNTFTTYLNERLGDGQATKEKINFFAQRVKSIFKQVEEEIQSVEVIRNASFNELELAQNELERFKTQTSDHLHTLAEYIESRKEEIISVTFKSIDRLERDIIEATRESIFLYEGAKFQSFIEKSIPIAIKNKSKLWVNQYSPQIDTLIKKLENEILKGFSALFKKEMNSLRLHHSSSQLEGINMRVKTKTGSSDTTVTSGLITAGAGAIMMIASGGLLLPFISMAGFPLLNKLLAEKKLAKLKDEATPLVEQEIHQVAHNLKEATSQHIENEVSHLQEKAVRRFKEYVISYEQNLELEISRRKNDNISEIPSIELQDLLLIQ
jgi:GTPase SAR1 family protein